MNVSKIIITLVASALITSSFAAGVKLELQDEPQSTAVEKQDHECCKCHKHRQVDQQHMGDNTKGDNNTTTAM